MKSRFLQFSLGQFDLEQTINKLKSQYGRQVGLKPIQILWIYLLSENPEGMSASMLAKRAHVDKALVSRELKPLMELGLVEKQQGTGYKKKIYLTEKGFEKAELIDAATLGIQHRLEQDIPQEDMNVFYDVLNKLTDGMDTLLQSIALVRVGAAHYARGAV